MNTGGFTAFLAPYNKVSWSNEALNGIHSPKYMQTKAKAAADMIQLNSGIRDIYWMLKLFEDILIL